MMKNFNNKQSLFDYLREVRIAMADCWDPSNAFGTRYVFPDYDEEEDEFEKQGVDWANPVPVNDENIYHCPMMLGLGKPGILFGLTNIGIDAEVCAPVFVWDAFDFDGRPATLCAFGECNSDLINEQNCHKLIEWNFEGFDDNDEMSWNIIEA